MEKIQVRGFRKPQVNSQLIVDYSFTPREIAKIKYYQLLEQQVIHKANLEEIRESKSKTILEYIKSIL